MANRLFDTPELVDVERDLPGETGMWTIGFDLQAASSAVTLYVQDPCSETPTYVAGATDASSPKVYIITSFSATVSARRNNRCALGIELELVSELLAEGGTEGAAEYVLWNGISTWDPNAQPSLQNNDVITVARQALIQDTVSFAVSKYATLTVVDDYVVHLGVQAAMDLSAQGYTETIDQFGQLRIKATGAPIVVSPYYPTLGVAVTGPLKVLIANPSAYQTYSAYNNRTNIVGYQPLAIAFDPSSSVRAV